jgi:hypothetical protein
MTESFTLVPCRRAGVAGFIAAVALAVLLVAPGVARAATPEFYGDFIHEGALSAPTWVEVVDVTGDGDRDLVTALSNYDAADPSRLGLVSVRAGNGEGEFGPAATFSTGGRRPYSLDVADVTGDGVLDIAVANRGSKTVTILKGDGTGDFVLSTRQPPFVVGTETIDVKALDLDDDGDLDLAATQMWNDPYTAGYLWLLYNDGTGFFRTVDMPLTNGTGCTVMGTGDLNGDDSVDVVVGHDWPSIKPSGTKASVLLNDGLGPHGSPIPTTNLVEGTALEVGNQPQGATIADFDEDGDKDVCVTSRYPNYANIFLGDGTGAFTGPTSYGVGAYAKVPTPVDLDKDGHLDLAVCNYGNEGLDPPGTTISILMGNGDGTFDAASDVTVGERPHSVGVGDLNGDNWPDLAIPNLEGNTVTVLYNTIPYSADTTKPVTTSSADGAWHTGAVTVTLSPTDSGGSGLLHTKYRVDGGDWKFGTTVNVSGDGTHTVQYYSVDYAGNVESAHNAQVKIDGTAPVTTSSADSAWHTGAVTVTLTPTDAVSGVAQSKYRVDAGAWQTGTSFTVTTDGDHTIDFYSVDAAGNQETTKSAHVKIDATQPEVTLLVPQDGAKYPQGAGVGCDWTRSDATSGVASEVAKIDGVVVAKGDPIGAVAEGAHTFSLTVTDVAGNVRTVTVDYDVVVADPATLTASAGATVLWGKSGAVSAVLKDAGSGAGIGGLNVRVESSTDNVAWTLVDTVTSDSTGLCQASVAPKALTYYRFKYEGDLDHGPCVSDAITVKVRPLVSKPKGPLKVKARAQFKVTGSLKPQFTAGAKTVKIAIYRNKGGKWRFVKSVYAVNSNSGDYTRYTLKLRLSVKGAYRFKATTRSTAAWPSSTSGFSRTTVVK